MLFTTDTQTLEDLNIFGKQGSASIFTIFDKCVTRGGAVLLEEVFRHPSCNEDVINQRSNVIQYFSKAGHAFPFDSASFDAIENYLKNTDERSRLSFQETSVTQKLTNLLAKDGETAAIKTGVLAVAETLCSLRKFINVLGLDAGFSYLAERNEMAALLATPAFETVFSTAEQGKLSDATMSEFDRVFRFRYRDTLKKLLRHIYHLDVYISVAKVAMERNFVFCTALPVNQHQLHIEGGYHPLVKNAVPASVQMISGGNVIFLTGANMAGKSTFMKSVSIAIFLAHMGFPVPAKQMKFSVLDGIYTTINLPDNLGMGASHFYAEVMRVKKIARELGRSKNLFIAFDELFRGTNVKDAYEATIAITKAFAKKEGGQFIISTHIIEAGEVLRQCCANIRFIYLPTTMEGTRPVYTYKPAAGITADRHGMVIINNEKILDILAAGISREDAGIHTTAKVQPMITEEINPFIADKQTLDDLNLLGKYKRHSIYSLFNKVKTNGGERLLETMFRTPMTVAADINTRSGIFQYFTNQQLELPYTNASFTVVENYLALASAGNIFSAATGIIRNKLLNAFVHDNHYTIIHDGILATIDAVRKLKDFLLGFEEKIDNPFLEQLQTLKKILADLRLLSLIKHPATEKLTVLEVARYDFLLRHTLRQQMEIILNGIYHLDVYIAVSKVAREKEFSYATALPEDQHLVCTTGLRHPALNKGVPNSLTLNADDNLLFLTGANMAGKSTYMKSFGIAIYLAHMGFPVAATGMKFSVCDGIYSSINVADDLNKGYSHFYAEVLRVKKAAEEVSARKNMVVIFDELFKGTNVKDAYDATLSVTAAFSSYRNCFFIVSTHITEVGDELQKHDGIRFRYLPTVMDGPVPRYTYQLQEGITADRQGMIIIENEGILDILS